MESETEMFQMEIDDNICSICFAEFLDSDDLFIHMKQMHTFGLVKCQFCEQKCTDVASYAVHIRDTHLVDIRCCQYCTRVFISSDKCRNHECKHCIGVPNDEYACSQCHEQFSDIPELENHEFYKHKDIDDGVFLQPILPYLSSILNIKALKFLQSIGNETVYTCALCELTTPHITVFIEHLKVKKCQSAACYKCSNVYKTKFNLAKHLRNNKDCSSSNATFKPKCERCDKKIPPHLLKEHKRNCMFLKCKICNWTMKSMYELTSHQSQFHPLTISLQTCKYCKRQFVGKYALNNHIRRTHISECHLYKYNCVYCGYMFTHPKKLFTHFYKHHKELEPYTCKICNLKFRLRKKFTLHIKLEHKSLGFVEFEQNLHVFFTDKKSETPLVLESGNSYPVVAQEKTCTTDSETNQQKNDPPVTEYHNQSGDTTKCEIKQENIDETTECEDKPSEIKPNTELLFQETNKSKMNLDNVCSDFMEATETEGNHTDFEKLLFSNRIKNKNKLRTTNRNREIKKEIVISDSSDDEPLLQVRKRLERKKHRNATLNKKKHTVKTMDRREFTCKICNQYCYTYQNYHNHMSLHSGNIKKTCVKCSKVFSSKEKLNMHMKKEHSSSKLTETLKKVLEKRKNGVTSEEQQMAPSEKFRRTIRKVTMENVDCVATIKPINNDLSVQKFIENFTPEVIDVPNKNIVIESEVIVKPIEGKLLKPPLIKLMKFKPKPPLKTSKLAMPIKFKPDLSEKPTVSIKIVKDLTPEENTVAHYDEDHLQSDTEQYTNEIPEVAQEVMLEVSEEPKPEIPKGVPHKIVIPNLPNFPEHCKEISIAHLMPEAPYFKIVKMKDLLKDQTKPIESFKETVTENIKLPNGTKLVNVNPLAHLLGNKSVENIFKNTKSKSTATQSKSKDIEMALAKVLVNLDKPVLEPKKKKK